MVEHRSFKAHNWQFI